jgi:hypothetical protein
VDFFLELISAMTKNFTLVTKIAHTSTRNLVRQLHCGANLEGFGRSGHRISCRFPLSLLIVLCISPKAEIDLNTAKIVPKGKVYWLGLWGPLALKPSGFKHWS